MGFACKIISDQVKVKFLVKTYFRNILYTIIHPLLTEIKFQQELQRIIDQNNDKFIVDAMTDFANVVDLNYTYLRINKAFCKAHGIKRRDFEGRTVADIWGKKVFNKHIKLNFDRAFKGEKVHYQEWFNFGKLGKRFMDVRFLPYVNEKGVVTHVAIISRDITHNEVRRQQREIMRKLGTPEEQKVKKAKGKKLDARYRLDPLCKVTREGLSLRAVYAFEYNEGKNNLGIVGGNSEAPVILAIMRKLQLFFNKNNLIFSGSP